MMAQDDAMAVLAYGTGGSFYHNNNDLDKGYRELGSIPELVYVLGFSPSDMTRDGKYHLLKVKAASGRHFSSLQARMGYTALSKTAPAELNAPSKLDTAVMGMDSVTDVPVTFLALPGQPENGAPGQTVVMHIDVKNLKFEGGADRRSLKFGFVITVADKSGTFIVGRQGEIEFALKQATFDAVSAEGLNVTIPLHAPPGAYTVRAAIQERLDGKLTSATLPVEFR